MFRVVYLIALIPMFFCATCGCGAKLLPAAPAGLTWQPGRYVKDSYFAPGFKPGEATYLLTPFRVTAAGGDNAAMFLKLFQEELAQAWEAQGLKVSPQDTTCRLEGTIQCLSVRGSRLRRITGRLHAVLTISGAITQGDQVLFAFQDRVAVSSPLAPGPPAPKEKELLLRQLARETVHHILNELLLHGDTADSG